MEAFIIGRKFVQDISRIGWGLALVVATGALAACTEKLTTVGDCPALCPGGVAQYRDTVIMATVGRDTSYAGYSTYRTASSLLLANGGAYGQSRAVLRYYLRGDSLQTDSLRPFTSIDSVFIELVPESWDAEVGGKVIDVYRLPSTIDTAVSLSAVDNAMTEESYLGSLEITGASTPTPRYLLFTGADLAKFTFAPGETTALVIGLRLRSDTPTGVRVGSSNSGSAAPSWTTWVTTTVADTLQRGYVQRTVFEDFSVITELPHDAALLRVGGNPATRTFVHFDLPPYLKDSSVIVRATLQLELAQDVPGIPGDSVGLVIENLIGDFGPKSTVYSSNIASRIIRTGALGQTSVEVVNLVRLWQGSNSLPSTIRLSSPFEGASFTVPTFLSTRSTFGAPRLRITFRPRFGYGGF